MQAEQVVLQRVLRALSVTSGSSVCITDSVGRGIYGKNARGPLAFFPRRRPGGEPGDAGLPTDPALPGGVSILTRPEDRVR